MKNEHLYALLVGVGYYQKFNLTNLTTYRMDLSLIGISLINGLKCPEEHIRIMAGEDNNGYVKATDVARGIAGIKQMMSNEDTFIFYFSGHGNGKDLIFSDTKISLQSVIDYMQLLPAKNKIVILDCCYSGHYRPLTARRFSFRDSLENFVHNGMAVLSSSSGNEESRLGPNNNHSMFTGALSTAIVMNKKIKKGLLDLNDVVDETKRLVEAWNKQNPSKEQTPVFRASVGGTILFPVEEYHPYETKIISYETDEYKIDRVEPLSSSNEKRLAAFVILKRDCAEEMLAFISKEIAEKIKYAEVYSSQKSEQCFEGTPAKAIWCYFGYDDSDMVNHLHAMYSIWAVPEVRGKYFKENKDAHIVDDIYIWTNRSYKLLRKLQKPTVSREEYILQNKKFLSVFINMAGDFMIDMQAVSNKEISLRSLQEKYEEWIKLVNARYIHLTDLDVPPEDLHDWAEEILNLAGCVLDVSILLEGDKVEHEIGERESWLIKHSVRRYNESLNRLLQIENSIDIDI